MSLDINEGIHNSQNLTTIVTMIILTFVLAIVFRSFRLGVITIVLRCGGNTLATSIDE